MMIVEILNNDKRFSIRKGFLFEAEIYSLDPSKIILLQRLRKSDKKPIGKIKMCNQYRNDVKILKQY